MELMTPAQCLVAIVPMVGGGALALTFQRLITRWASGAFDGCSDKGSMPVTRGLAPLRKIAGVVELWFSRASFEGKLEHGSQLPVLEPLRGYFCPPGSQE